MLAAIPLHHGVAIDVALRTLQGSGRGMRMGISLKSGRRMSFLDAIISNALLALGGLGADDLVQGVESWIEDVGQRNDRAEFNHANALKRGLAQFTGTH